MPVVRIYQNKPLFFFLEKRQYLYFFQYFELFYSLESTFSKIGPGLPRQQPKKFSNLAKKEN